MTITGFIVFGLISTLVFLHRRSILLIVLNPLFWIYLDYIRYFGFSSSSSETLFLADVYNSLGLIFFLAAFILMRGFISSRPIKVSANILWPEARSPITNQGYGIRLRRPAVVLLFIAVLMWAMLDLWLNTIAYGSLDRALVRFYTVSASQEIPPFWQRILRGALGLAAASLFLLRINARMRGDQFSKALFWSAISIYILACIPQGTVGRILGVAILVVFADAVLVYRGEVRRFSYFTYAWFTAGLVSIGFILITVRGGSFQTPQEVIERISSIGSSDIMFAAARGHSIVLEYVAFCIKTYGSARDYLYFHTPYSIAVNLVPREFWPEKPVGFGRILALDAGAHPASTTSYAAGIAGEGYASGGVFGVVIMASFVGAICGAYAKIAHILFRSSSVVHLMLAFLFWRASYSFVRGDMLSAWTSSFNQFLFVCATIIFCRIIWSLLRVRKN